MSKRCCFLNPFCFFVNGGLPCTDRLDYLITALHEPIVGQEIQWRTVDVTSVTKGKALGEGGEDDAADKHIQFDLGSYNFKIVMDVAPKPVRVPKPKKTSSSTKKTKKKKNNSIKRNLNPYMFFSSDRRGEVVLANPEDKMSEIAKKLGVLWKELNEEDKAPYQLLADQDKTRYVKAMAVQKKKRKEKKAKAKENKKQKEKEKRGRRQVGCIGVRLGRVKQRLVFQRLGLRVRLGRFRFGFRLRLRLGLGLRC